MFWDMTKTWQPKTSPTEEVSIIELLSSPCSEQCDLVINMHPQMKVGRRCACNKHHSMSGRNLARAHTQLIITHLSSRIHGSTLDTVIYRILM